jgi:hypothetical protein
MLNKAYRPLSAIMLAALVAGAWIILPGASATVVASSPLNNGKGDRLDYRPLGSQCSEQAWPYFEASCLRDKRHANGQVKPVRIVTADSIRSAR